MWDADTNPKRMLTFRSGGWVLLLTAVIAVMVLLIVVAPALRRLSDRPPGDGKDPATYGFALSPSLIPREEIVAAQLHRDLLEALVQPPVMDGTAVAAFNEAHRGKYLVSHDRVIGVEIGEEARAYPLLVLASHEIVNDIVGGVPIAVTYNPLCDSVVVFDRTIGGEVLEFGVSGLVYNSNLLMYDRGPEIGGESLWSQLQGRAVTGPAAAAGRELTLIPAQVTHWGDWSSHHPDTTVLAVGEAELKRYKYQYSSYEGYFVGDELLFPVDVPLPADGPRPKTPCVIVFADEAQRIYPLSGIADRAGASGQWRDELNGEAFTFRHAADPDVVRVRSADGDPATVIYSFLFAWQAMHPGAELADL
ncbi:MAG: DUF3179 domain-containing (seleno)protein [Planctomycetota bacterium]|nr:DUF3179 domain-containing (seleno)protein [Planctomycetota bacterium]